MTRAGFIGLGSQGAGMAQRIIEQGVPTTLWARTANRSSRSRARRGVRRRSGRARAHERRGRDLRHRRRRGARGHLGAHGRARRDGPGERARVALDDRHRRVRRDRQRRGGGGVHVIDAPVSGGGAAAAAGGSRCTSAGPTTRCRPGPPGARDVRQSGAAHGRARSGPAHEAAQQRAERRALRARPRRVGDRAALGLDAATLGEALRSGSGRSFSLEVFVGLRSFDAIAGYVGPIMSKDIALFEARRGRRRVEHGAARVGRPVPRPRRAIPHCRESA